MIGGSVMQSTRSGRRTAQRVPSAERRDTRSSSPRAAPSSERSYDVEATRTMSHAVVLELARLVLVPVQDARHDLDVVVLRERLAELGEQVRGRLDAGPVVLVEDENSTPRHGFRLAPIGDGLSHRFEEPLDARPVAPVAGELTRTGALGATTLGIRGELAQRPRRRIDVAGSDERSRSPRRGGGRAPRRPDRRERAGARMPPPR